MSEKKFTKFFTVVFTDDLTDVMAYAIIHDNKYNAKKRNLS